jgi:hypothetical protein
MGSAYKYWLRERYFEGQRFGPWYRYPPYWVLAVSVSIVLIAILVGH